MPKFRLEDNIKIGLTHIGYSKLDFSWVWGYRLDSSGSLYSNELLLWTWELPKGF
jgi:hypothetical protein